MSERVWCVPAALVAEHSRGRTFWPPGDDAEVDRVLAELAARGEFRPRAACETDETVRQVIPYLLVRRGDGGYLTYRRLPASGEERLVDLYSLGFGGHINDEHLVPGLQVATAGLRPNLLADGLQRELTEEMVLPGEGLSLRLHGFLALSETPVDRVHVGAVAILHLAHPAGAGCTIRETDKLAEVGWHDASALAELTERVTFEGWSRTLIEVGLP